MKRKSRIETPPDKGSQKRRKLSDTSTTIAYLATETAQSPVTSRARSKSSSGRTPKASETTKPREILTRGKLKNVMISSKENSATSRKSVSKRATETNHQTPQIRSSSIKEKKRSTSVQDSNAKKQKSGSTASMDDNTESTPQKNRNKSESETETEQKLSVTKGVDTTIAMKAEEALRKRREEWQLFDSFDLESTEQKKFDSEELNPAPLGSPATPEPTFLLLPDRSEVAKDDFLDEELGVKKTPKVIGPLPRPSLPPSPTPQNKEKFISEIKKQLECMDPESRRMFLLGLRKSLLRQSLSSQSVTASSKSVSPSRSPPSAAKEITEMRRTLPSRSRQSRQRHPPKRLSL
jgi:hypothetical protein